MDRSQVIARLQHNADSVRGMGATGLYLFGSVAKGGATAASDVDLFIDYDPAGRFSLFDLVGIQQLLEDDMALAIDITTRDSLHPALKRDIETTAIKVF